MLLSRHGVQSLLIEQQAGTSVHPKARGLNVRTLELFRVWGIEPDVRAAASELDQTLDVVWAPTLVAPETMRRPYGGTGERSANDSPTGSLSCPQEKLEPVLLEAARSYGLGEVRFCHELIDLEQADAGVTATVLDRGSGEQIAITADWMIAADGAHSTVRSKLGISMVGPGALFHRMDIHFRADLRDVYLSRPSAMYFVSPPGGGGPMGPQNIDENRWRYQAPFHPERGGEPEEFPAERCVQLVREAVGIDDLQVEILSAAPWSGTAAVCDRFRDGRVFLAGDAAHLISPAGGQGMNVGIHGVHNLAWKLAAVVHGWAGDGLLESYEAERRPFALLVNQDVARNIAAGSGTRLEQFSNRGRVLGITYDSSAVVADGSELPAVANSVVEYVPSARPGSRAPHLWLWRNGEKISTLDLFDREFVMLTGPQGILWCSAAEAAAKSLGVPLRAHVVGTEGPLVARSGEWAALYGVEDDGAVLVRPDGHVAWRRSVADPSPATRMKDVLCRVISR